MRTNTARTLILASWTLATLGCQDPEQVQVEEDPAGGGESPSAFGVANCDAPEPEYLHEDVYTLHAVAVSGETLVFGGNAGLYVMPKDGSAEPERLWGMTTEDVPPVDLWETDWVNDAEVRDGTIYFTSTASSFKVDLAGGDVTEWGSHEELVVDGGVLYAYTATVGCALDEPVYAYQDAVDGSAADTLQVPCVEEADAFGGVVVASAGDGPDFNSRLLRLDPENAPEPLDVAPADETIYGIQLTDAYAYYEYGHYADFSGNDTLARVRLSDGRVETLGHSNLNAILGTKDGIYAHDGRTNCLHWRADDGTVKSLANVGTTEALAMDADYVYGVTYGGLVYRVAR